MIERQLIISEDGSHTIHDALSGENYHSIHGAIQESNHVFIESALKPVISRKKKISILEIGWGTGLNTLLSAVECESAKIQASYIAVEPFPISLSEASQLNYWQLINHPQIREWTMKMHSHNHQYPFYLSENFVLKVLTEKMQDLQFASCSFDVIFFDAFSPESSPQLWEESIFEILFSAMQYEGILTTYCAKGEVRRRMQKAGFQVERIPGAKGKREMLKAIKPMTDPEKTHHHHHD